MTQVKFIHSSVVKVTNEPISSDTSKKPSIAVVSPEVKGGVRTIVSKLIKGLQLEGFYTKLISIRGTNILTKLRSDLVNLKELRNFDIIIYMGSIPWPSNIFIEKATALFVHGFIRHELINTIKHESHKVRLGAIFLLSSFNISKILDKIDLYISPSLTVCEANGITDRFTLLPNWISPEELKLSKKAPNLLNERSTIRMVTYTSYAFSPRLLNRNHMIALAQTVKRIVKQRFELINS